MNCRLLNRSASLCPFPSDTQKAILPGVLQTHLPPGNLPRVQRTVEKERRRDRCAPRRGFGSGGYAAAVSLIFPGFTPLLPPPPLVAEPSVSTLQRALVMTQNQLGVESAAAPGRKISTPAAANSKSNLKTLENAFSKKTVEITYARRPGALWSRIGKNTDKIAIESFPFPRARE